MTGATYDGTLGLIVRGRHWRRTQRPPLSLTVLERADHLLVLPADQSGGLRGGDSVATEVEVGGSGWVDWRPPSSSLFFPSADRTGTCTVKTRLQVQAGSRLSWTPPVAIPCAGSRIDQSVEIDLEPGAELLYWDGWADGRTSSGERGAFAELSNRLDVRWNGRTVFRERWVLQGCVRALDPAGFHGASQWHLAVAAGPGSIAALQERVDGWKRAGESAEAGELAEGLWLARVLSSRPIGRLAPAPG